MGFRFQRRVTLFPGVRLNFSRRGISTTIGPRGASLHFGSSGAALNLGVPGTGLSFRRKLTSSGSSGPRDLPAPDAAPVPAPVALPELGARQIASAPAEEVTSDGLDELKRLILEARAERRALQAKLPGARSEFSTAERRVRNAKHWLWKHFVGKHLQEREAALQTKTRELKELEERVEAAVIDIDFGMNESVFASFAALSAAFVEMTGAERIWDITSEADVDRRATRSSAGKAVALKPVRLDIIEDDLLLSDTKLLRFGNANGAELLIYPAFLMAASGTDFGLIDLREVSLAFGQIRFVETGKIPSDAVVVDTTWAKVNRDGRPDKRFKGNYRIPVVGYGGLAWKSLGGINEQYMVSSSERASRFAQAFVEYQNALRALGAEGNSQPQTRKRQLQSPTAPGDAQTPVPSPLPPVPEPATSGPSRLVVIAGLSFLALLAWSVVGGLRSTPASSTVTAAITATTAPSPTTVTTATAATTATAGAVAGPGPIDAITVFKDKYGLPDSDKTEASDRHSRSGGGHRYLAYKKANVKVHFVKGAMSDPWQVSEFEELKPRRMLDPVEAYKRLERQKQKRRQ